jgi:hypothetical protein
LAVTGITALVASSCGGSTSADLAANETHAPSSAPRSNEAEPSSAGATRGQGLTTVQSDIISPAFAYSYLYGQSPNPNATDAFDLSWSAYLADLGVIVKEAKSIAGTISSIISGFNATISVLQFLGLLPAPVDEVALLTQDVNAIGTGITWQNLHDYVDPRLSGVQTVAQIDIPEQGVSNVVTSGEDGVAASEVQDLFTYSAWHRAAVGSGNDSSTDKALPHPGIIPQLDNWKQLIAPAPIDAMNEVFEWRLGAPAVLRAIALRMTIMGAINPHFATDPAYRPELQSMHDGLAQVYQTMLAGIKCAWRDYGYGPGLSKQGKLMTVSACEIVCADIYTGISSLTAITPSSVNGSYNNSDGTCEAHVNTEAFADAVNQTNYNVRSKVPLFEMQSMIDLLETMLRGAPDLTQKYHRITPQSQQTLCVGTVGASGNWGTNLQLTACNSSDPSQYWTYNRTTGQIYNPNLNVCIDERWGLSYGTDIGVWQCDTPHAPPDDPAAPPSQIDNLAQKWTFDPTSGELRNGFGVAMAWFINPISPGPASQGNLIVTEVVGQGGYDVPALDYSSPKVNMAWHADGFTKGDGNGDALTDIYLAGAGGGNIPVAENLNGGNFYCDAPSIDNTQFSDVWAKSPNVKVLTGDFNGDGLSDILLTGVSGWQSLPIAFKTGNGFHVTNGTNSYIVNFAGWATWQNAWPVTGDFNGDGRTDIALVGSPGYTTLPVAISNGDGTFYTANNAISSTFYGYAAQPGARPVTGDFNGDGLSDIAIIGGTTANLIPIALSNGDGTFTVQSGAVTSGDTNFTIYSTGAGVHAVSGDFDGDGKGDIALTGGSGWWTVPVAFSNGNGTFRVTNNGISWGDGGFPTYASWGAQPVSGDFNNDGKSDIALTGGSGWWTIPVAFSNGDGTWGVTNNSTQGLNFPGQASTPGVYAVAGGY